mmetsp:Transcript_14654/g.36503  ORF Transcript_14654/g.36503 Transcript_14654/m.36503 type:complete len:207 (+) Transcript_14654:934-1554(+)
MNVGPNVAVAPTSTSDAWSCGAYGVTMSRPLGGSAGSAQLSCSSTELCGVPCCTSCAVSGRSCAHTMRPLRCACSTHTIWDSTLLGGGEPEVSSSWDSCMMRARSAWLTGGSAAMRRVTATHAMQRLRLMTMASVAWKASSGKDACRRASMPSCCLSAGGAQMVAQLGGTSLGAPACPCSSSFASSSSSSCTASGCLASPAMSDST